MTSLNKKYDYIILDIEGTTTSISFVKDILFPYVTKNLKKYLTLNFDELEVQQDIAGLRELSLHDIANGVEGAVAIEGEDMETIISKVIENVAWQMSIDRKTKELKLLQGHMWRSAYENKEITGHIYSDVKSNFEKWVEAGIKIFIYSSGSVEAQRLLFGFSDEGNLLPFISGHFDTSIGYKQQTESYHAILNHIGVSQENTKRVLFCTDMLNEAIPAAQAGIEAIIMLRPGNNPIHESDLSKFTTAKSFDELQTN